MMSQAIRTSVCGAPPMKSRKSMPLTLLVLYIDAVASGLAW